MPCLRSPLRAAVRLAVLISLLLAPASATIAEQPSEAEFPRPTMRSVFEDIKKLVPLSMSEERWSAKEDRKMILATLARLQKSAIAIELHGRDREAGFSEIAVTLMGDLSEAHEFYRNERFEEARFFLSGSLQSCVSCHVRLSTDRSFSFANELMDEEALDVLEPRDRAFDADHGTPV